MVTNAAVTDPAGGGAVPPREAPACRPVRDPVVAPPSLSAWEPGQVVAQRYRLLSDRREEGAWEVVDEQLKRRCALHPLPPGVQRSPEKRARITEMGRLGHPNLAAVWNLVPERGSMPAFLVTQRAAGVQLARLVPAAGLARDLALPLVAQVASGLAAAHDRGLHHGRLDARQVWVEPTGDALVTQLGFSELGGGWVSDAADLESLRLMTMTMARHELAARQFAGLFEGQASAAEVRDRALTVLDSLQEH